MVAAASFSSLLAAPVSFAGHTVPNPLVYWDCSLQGQPDESCVRITMAGGGWDANRQARFTEAVGHWQTTDFDPYVGAGNLREAFVQGNPSCKAFNGAYAVTCIPIQWDVNHWRITDANVWFNTAGFNWNTAIGADFNKADFRGVATHEVGHFLFLNDTAACGPVGDRYTMCGSATLAETFQVRDLETDDKNSANTVY